MTTEHFPERIKDLNPQCKVQLDRINKKNITYRQIIENLEHQEQRAAKDNADDLHRNSN